LVAGSKGDGALCPHPALTLALSQGERGFVRHGEGISDALTLALSQGERGIVRQGEGISDALTLALSQGERGFVRQGEGNCWDGRWERL